jgi:hypothetical protein
MKISIASFFSTAGRTLKAMHAPCAHPACPNTLIMRTVGQSQVGIRVGSQWYCSLDCFAGGTRAYFTKASSGRVLEMPHSPRMPIGLVMLSKGYLTDAQLRAAMAQSRLHGEELERTLLRLGLANEGQLAASKAAQWGHPVFAQDGVGQPVEADIPPTLLRWNSAVPLHYSIKAKRVLLGFVDRVEHSLLDSIEQITGCRVDPCFITPTKFTEQMALLSNGQDYEEAVLSDSLSPSQMSKTMAAFAVEISATEASFAQNRSFLWARLSGRRRKVDLLFRCAGALDSEKNENFSYLRENIS